MISDTISCFLNCCPPVYSHIYFFNIIYLFIFADPASIDWLHSVAAEKGWVGVRGRFMIRPHPLSILQSA